MASKQGIVLKSIKNKTIKKLDLKKGDIVQSFNGKSLSSQGEFFKKILLVKKGKFLSIKLKRKNKNYSFIYKNIGGNKYRLIKKSKKRRKTQVKKTNKISKPKKKNILGKYKSHLQHGYIIAAEGLIYKKPNFDSEQIFYLTSGTKALLSKKIFTPSHRFGTFYKIFIKKPKKIVGYISEVDVIPEYESKSKNKSNPKYKLVEKQLTKHGNFNLESLNKNKNFLPKRPHGKSAAGKGSSTQPLRLRRYGGFSMSRKYDSELVINDIFKDMLFGLKFSGKNLLLSNIETDINLSVSSDFKVYYSDILIGYPLVGGYKYTVYIMGGVKVNYYNPPLPVGFEQKPTFNVRLDLGPVASLSFVYPFKDRLVLRADLKLEYGISAKKTEAAFLASIQMGF